ncbi:hypothetical protein EPC71_08075 [Helicobacter pylori]|uniref:hypothetical protein n=1 Tax=Helicobacter pylori TaxID=210 RepID=UPI00123B1FF9|nr:hypothetical protein [Helicobacter pylori]KAA6502830.1 hypothetical protein EPC71_08075 [Helicobacter pylori]
MWNEKILKIIPALLFLFCLLEIFELVLIINDMNKTEKLEQKLAENVKSLEAITDLLNNDKAGLENFKKKHR